MAGSAESSIMLVSDDVTRSNRLAHLFSHRFHVQTTDLSQFRAENAPGLSYIVDANLSDPQTVTCIRERITRVLPGKDKYFVINDDSRTDLMQANSLGARDVLRKSCIERDAALLINRLNQRLLGDLWRDQPPATHLALSSINLLNDNLFAAVATNSPLPRTQVADCCEYLITNLEDQAISPWLDAVRQHHSYTYRHSMIVSGLAVFFALNLGMRRSDVERLAIGALMHDLGKMRLPLGLLDKPGALTDKERKEIRTHPVLGAKILEADKQFSPEVVAIARHHHEFLDGSGYPDQLKGNEISDTVRIMTVVDIFSALIDERSYKAAMPCERAYAMLTEMDGKLDPDIVRAFEPIALNAGEAQGGMAHAAE